MKNIYTLFLILLCVSGCAKPQSGSDGQDGATIVGPMGAQGPVGAPGVNAASVVPVKFCPGFTPTYPTTFAEYGLCINNVMYGVYSANGGFLAELPPGAYNSDGIGADCHFTLEANCVVEP